MELQIQVEINDLKYLTKGRNSEDIYNSVIFGSTILRELLT